MNHQIPTINLLRTAVESRDASSLKSFYADDAVLTIIDSDNPPSRPRTLKGAREIGEFLDDVCARDMTHTIESGAIEGNTLAFLQGCRYGDGTRVMASSVAELGPEGIVRQTTVQAWDS
jgi:ketosteroid isomerase-like protein